MKNWIYFESAQFNKTEYLKGATTMLRQVVAYIVTDESLFSDCTNIKEYSNRLEGIIDYLLRHGEVRERFIENGVIHIKVNENKDVIEVIAD